MAVVGVAWALSLKALVGLVEVAQDQQLVRVEVQRQILGVVAGVRCRFQRRPEAMAGPV
jgi:hypothetical protein